MEVSMRDKVVITLIAISLFSPLLAQQSGKVEGFVGFGENFPPPKRITISRDVQVCGTHQFDEEFVVNGENYGLANAVIYWELPEGSQATGNSAPVVLAQNKCRYEPHIQVASSEADILRVLNMDGILHNVHIFDEDGNTFLNFAQPGFKKQIDKELPNGRVINIKCDVHNWMNAYILTLPNAIYAITDENGQFSLEGIAPGSQTIHIWHEGIGSTSREVMVEVGQVAILEFVIGK